LCGVSPIPASSGKTVRHRLSRGGDRAANGALDRITLVRMSSDPRTTDYVARQRDAGFSTKEILRKLKRAIVREVFRLLTTPVAVPGVDDLRPLRQAKNITLTAARTHSGSAPPRSANSNAASAATTTSPRPTVTGSERRSTRPATRHLNSPA
jgi:transposase